MTTALWKLAITPLSPVHMGTAADYDPTNYVIEDETLYHFNSMVAMRALPEIERAKLLKLLDGRADERMLRLIQQFFYDNRSRFKDGAEHLIYVRDSVEKYYQSRVGQVSQREAGGRYVQNKLQIERCAWNPPSQRPILPGSGLKGAIRTALLDRLNNGESLDSDLKRDRRANQKLQERLLQGSFATDPLRLVKLSDANTRDGIPASTAIYFALNRTKKSDRKEGERLRDAKAEQKGIPQMLECVPGFLPRAFAGQLELENINCGNPEKYPAMQFNLAEIASACNQFYGQRLQQEMKQLQSLGYMDPDWGQQVNQLLSLPWVRAKLADNRLFLLRVGRHSGAESVTLNGLRCIKIKTGRHTHEYKDYATTFWLAGSELTSQRDLLPFGWLLVEVFKKDESLEDWPLALKNDEILQWRQTREQAQAERLAEINARKEAQMREEAAERQHEAEEKAAAQARADAAAERKAREQAAFDALSESGKHLFRLDSELAALGNLVAPVPKDRYALLVGLLNSYADVAASWEATDPSRAKLAELMQQVYESVGWYPAGTDKKKRAKQENKKREIIERVRKG